MEKIKELKSNIKFAGATDDPYHRKRQHERDDYQGTMICADVENMKEAETELLKECKRQGACEFNIQHCSNAKKEPGYTYIIVQMD